MGAKQASFQKKNAIVVNEKETTLENIKRQIIDLYDLSCLVHC